ncbi:MAG: late competence development ComFB family protein [Brevinematales bacterium]|jgi:hypothetical protein
MVELKNVIEDIVFDMIDGLDEAKKGDLDKNKKKEIAAYVLNRLKPMYITSNKGFNNIILRNQKDPQFVADIMLRISEALKIVVKSSIQQEAVECLEMDKLYYIFPKIYGKIISKNMLPLSGAQVTLLIDNTPAVPMFELWKNPAEILDRDDGVYSFAPKPITANPPYEKKNFIISVRIEKAGEKYEKILGYEVIPSLPSDDENELYENVLQLEDIYAPF